MVPSLVSSLQRLAFACSQGRKIRLPEHGGDSDKLPLGEGINGIIGDEIIIQRRIVGKQWIGWRTWKRLVEIGGLKFDNIKTPQTRQRTLCACASGTLHQVIVLILTFCDCSYRSERLGFGQGSLEQTIVSSAIRDHMLSDRPGPCASSTNGNVFRISTKLYAPLAIKDIEITQRHSLTLAMFV